MSDERTETMVADNLRPDHVSGSASAIATESAGNVSYWNANRAVVEAMRAYRSAINDYRVSMPEVQALSVKMFAALDVFDKLEKRT